jgi:hypothetical protein
MKRREKITEEIKGKQETKKANIKEHTNVCTKSGTK